MRNTAVSLQCLLQFFEMSFHDKAHFTMVSFRVDFLLIVMSIVQSIISDSYLLDLISQLLSADCYNHSLL